MTTPTLEQLAPNVPPIIREYLDLYVRQMIAAVLAEQTAINTRMNAIAGDVEAQVQSMRTSEASMKALVTELIKGIN